MIEMRVSCKTDPAVSSVHVVWGPMALLIIAGAGYFKDLLNLLPSCIFHRITGIPCLTCGGTRSLVALSQFDIVSSFLLNPVFSIFAVGVIVFSLISLYGYLMRKSIVIRLSEGRKKALRVSIIGLLAANWVYLIMAGR
jgi:hypothetical protein